MQLSKLELLRRAASGIYKQFWRIYQLNFGKY
jgi:hypothetical protein